MGRGEKTWSSLDGLKQSSSTLLTSSLQFMEIGWEERQLWRRCVEVWGVMSLQCEPTQRWRREDGDAREAGVGGRHIGGTGGWALRALKAASPLALPCAPPPPPWLDLNRSASLAGLHTQLLPVGRLLCLRLGARVGASVERRHGAAFGIGVQAAVGWRVAGLELGGALHLLQSTDCTWTRRETWTEGRGLEDKQRIFNWYYQWGWGHVTGNVDNQRIQNGGHQDIKLRCTIHFYIPALVSGKVFLQMYA